MKILELPERVRCGLEGRVDEVPENKAERFLVTNLLERLGGESSLVGSILTRNVTEIDLRERRLLGREDGRQVVDAPIGNSRPTRLRPSAITLPAARPATAISKASAASASLS